MPLCGGGKGVAHCGGSFRQYNDKGVSNMVPLCALAARIRFESVEEGEKEIRATFIDADSRNILPPMERPIRVRLPEGMRTASYPLSLIIGQIKFERAGEYMVQLAVDGASIGAVPLYVNTVRSKAVASGLQTPEDLTR